MRECMKFLGLNKFVNTYIKKAFSITLIFMLVAGSSIRYPVFAQEVPPQDPTPTVESTPSPEITPPATESLDTTPPTPTDTPTPNETITNDTTDVTNDLTSNGNSGNNEIVSPTPTPTPDILSEGLVGETGNIATDTATPDNTDSSSEGVAAATSSTQSSDTHNEGGGGSPGGSGSGNNTPSITTGDATSITTIDNNVNTTSINATTVHQTINIFVSQDTPIDLSLAAMKATAEVLSGPQSQNENVNVGITVNNDIVYVNNDIASQAISGQNTANGNGSQISTGDAASAVSLLNSINTTIVNSVIHIYTINIFAVDSGNIILPELSSVSTTGACCQGDISVTNTDTTLTNTVDSLANTGNNTITGSGTITTGGAYSAVNVTNLVNTTITDAVFYQLFINVFGLWDGQFRGWNTLTAQSGGASISLMSITPNASGSGTCDCSGDITINNSSVTVNNNVSSLANTGNNTVNGRRAGITTGNAYSAVNIVNLVNSSFINSIGFFAFINVFGTLHGDIGGASTFVTTEDTPAATPTPDPSANVGSAGSDVSQPHESGGKLTVINTNNVGAWVLPGDTVTFFIKAKNIGTGTVYDAGIDLGLINSNGKVVGGRHYTVGNIALNTGVKLTTGFVLSPKTPPGRYIARAVITGKVGPNNDTETAFADSTFLVYGTTFTTNVPPVAGTTMIPELPRVLGVTSIPKENPNILMALFVLFLLVPFYKSLRLINDPGQIRIIFAPQQSLAYRFRAIMTLLL